jgi:hypothetical protein
MGTRAGQLAAINDQILLADWAALKPAFQNFPRPGRIASLR